MAEPVAVVLGGTRGDRRPDLTVDKGDHAWDMARLGWALHGSTTALTVPIGEFTGSDAGSVVVWDHEKAAQLFDALAADQPAPAAVLGDRP